VDAERSTTGHAIDRAVAEVYEGDEAMGSGEARDPVATSRTRSGTTARAGAAGLTVVTALLGTGALATSAGATTVASPRASSAGTVGTVNSLDAKTSSFTVRTSTGATVKVKVSRATTYREVGVTSPGFADVKVGESVAVIGTTSSGVETAIVVVVGHASAGGAPGPGGPGGFFGGGTFGKVTEVDSSAHSFTVKPASGSTVKVEVGKDTTYRDVGVKSPSFADVKVGESVVVVGTTKSGVETARTVVIGTFGPRPAAS
jgi:preprotein translocase subunit YajC